MFLNHIVRGKLISEFLIFQLLSIYAIVVSKSYQLIEGAGNTLLFYSNKLLVLKLKTYWD